MGERVTINGSSIYPVNGISGTVDASASSLYANGKKVGLKGDLVSENGGTGSVIEGNDNNVFFNGKSVSIRGDYTQTHVSSTKSIVYSDVAKNVYIGCIKDNGLDNLSNKIDYVSNQAPPTITVGNGSQYSVQTRSWRDNWGWRTATDGSIPDEEYYVYQGEWCELNGGTCWGNHKGLIVFPQYLRDECLGKKISKIEIYMHRTDVHGYYYKQPLYVYTHMYTDLFPEPNTGLAMNEPIISNYGGEVYGNDGTGWEINEMKWGTLPSSYNDLLSQGKMTGVAFYRQQRDHYMHFQKDAGVRVTFG